MAAPGVPAEIVSIVPFIVLFTKSISSIWFLTALISLESGTITNLISVEDAPSTFSIDVILRELTLICPPT